MAARVERAYIYTRLLDQDILNHLATIREMEEDAKEHAAEMAAMLKLKSSIGIAEGEKWPGYGWPGGYDIAYITDDADTMCARCMNEESVIHFSGMKDGWLIEGFMVLEESSSDILCCNCGATMFTANLTENGEVI